MGLTKIYITLLYRECITCLYCLPIISHKQSSQGAPEWTCIIVGFNTGHVRMYSEVCIMYSEVCIMYSEVCIMYSEVCIM